MKKSPMNRPQSQQKFRWNDAFLTFLFCIAEGTAVADGLTVNGYDKVGSERINRVVYQFTYSLNVLNSGESDAFGVTAAVSSTSPHTVIVDGNVDFGEISAGTSKTGSDTFSFQHDRRFAFDPNALQFSIQSTQPPANVTVPYVQTMTHQQAESILTGVGLTVGEIRPVANLTVPAGLVYGQTPATGTKVVPGSSVDLRVSAPPPEGGVTVPDSWAGIWKITVTYVDQATDAIVFQHSAEASICPSDLIGLTAVNEQFLNCNAESNGDSLTLSCSSEIVEKFCSINSFGHFAMTRLNSELTGMGSITVIGNEGCPNGATDNNFTIQVSGALQNEAPIGCELPRSSLSQSFLRHPFVMVLDRFELIGAGQ
ncbi:MAG: PASTA domain-containing protein [Gammaproteobacteria bacterium]